MSPSPYPCNRRDRFGVNLELFTSGCIQHQLPEPVETREIADQSQRKGRVALHSRVGIQEEFQQERSGSWIAQPAHRQRRVPSNRGIRVAVRVLYYGRIVFAPVFDRHQLCQLFDDGLILADCGCRPRRQ